MRQHTTGVAFGARGDRVIAMYHADHVYAFDITSSSVSASMKGERFSVPSQPGCCAPARGLGSAEGRYRPGLSPVPMEAETASHM